MSWVMYQSYCESRCSQLECEMHAIVSAWSSSSNLYMGDPGKLSPITNLL